MKTLFLISALLAGGLLGAVLWLKRKRSDTSRPKTNLVEETADGGGSAIQRERDAPGNSVPVAVQTEPAPSYGEGAENRSEDIAENPESLGGQPASQVPRLIEGVPEPEKASTSVTEELTKVLASSSSETTCSSPVSRDASAATLGEAVTVTSSGGLTPDTDSPKADVETESQSGQSIETEPAGEIAQPAVPESTTRDEKTDEPSRFPTYRPPVPAPAVARRPPRRREPRQSDSDSSAELHLRVQLAFDRAGGVKTLALVAGRREGMPDEIEVRGAQAELRLTGLGEDCYEPVPLLDAGTTLQKGVEWLGGGAGQRWRWVLGGRELYVLTSGDVGGLYPYGSSPRLALNAHHVVLAKASFREMVLAALTVAGCPAPEVSDAGTPGVPSGWVLFRDVTPTRAVPMRDERDILNVLCPVHDIEPHFVGGIRLERNTWLAGFPPRIRFTGELGSGFQVLIDGQPAQQANGGAFEAPGWDANGAHQLWFGDRAETYSLLTMEEDWKSWHAHDFGTGVAICGAAIGPIDGTQRRQVRIPAANPLLVGSRPGEAFQCTVRTDLRSDSILALAPFPPVWALPIDPLHADKRSVRIVLLEPLEPVMSTEQTPHSRNADHALRQWTTAINNAGRKQLALTVESQHAKALWRRYRALAKQLWKRMP